MRQRNFSKGACWETWGNADQKVACYPADRFTCHPRWDCLGGKSDSSTEESAFRQVTKFGFSGEAIQGGVIVGDAPAGTRSLAFDGNPVPMDADGKFIVAFNRDAGQAATLVATLENGQTVRQFLISRRASGRSSMSH